MNGIHYCSINERLQLRLCRPHCTLEEVTESILQESDRFENAKILKVSLCRTYRVGTDSLQKWRRLVQALSSNLPNIETLQIQSIKEPMMFPLNQVGRPPIFQAFFPVLVFRCFLEAFARITALKLCDLQLTASTPSNALLAEGLTNHSSLLSFTWQYCNFLPPSGNSSSSDCESLDPIWDALASIPTLENIVVQTRPEKGRTAPLARLAPRLKRLHIKGMPCCLPERLGTTNLEELELCLSSFGSHSAMEVAQWILSPKLRALTIHLGSSNIPSLQRFQDEIAGALFGRDKLQKLHILCPALSTTGNQLCLGSFQKALRDGSSSLISLCLPLCGELDDEIAFFLQVNQSGIRSLLEQSAGPDRLEQAWKILETVSKEDLRFSMMYYFLRESPLVLANW